MSRAGAFAEKSFRGREVELAALERAVGPGRFVLLLGPGGAGKTRLARRFVASRPDVVFCDLSSARSLGDLVGVVAAELGVSLGAGGTRDSVEQVAHALAERRDAVVVLDNLESVPSAASLLGAWIDRGPPLLGTSRVRLGLPSEVDLEVGPLSQDDALALFLDRVRVAAPEMAVDAPTRVLVERLAGSPLAIELLAARAHVLSPAALLARFSSHLDLLRSTAPELPERHRSLRAVVAGSWALSGEVEQRALASASVFRGSFDLDAAEAVIGPDAADALEALLASSLVSRLGQPEGARFSLSESVREYAFERLSDDPSRLSDALRRHADHYRVLAESLSDRAYNAEPGASARLLREADNLLAAFRQDGRSALAFNTILHRVLPADGQLAELEEARARLPADEHGAHAEIELALVRAVRRQGGASRTMGHAERAEALAARSGRPGLVADAAHCMTLALFDLGRVAEAKACGARAISLAESCGATALAARSLDLLGFCALEEGDYALASRSAERVLVLAQSNGYRMLESFAENLLGSLHSRTGELAAAERHLRRGLSLVREIGHATQEAILLGNLAKVLVLRGDHAGARELVERALALSRRAGLRKTEAAHLVSLASVEADEGRLADARASAALAESIAREVGHGRQALGAALLLGAVALEERRWTDARVDFDRALSDAAALESAPGRALSLAGLAVVSALEGDGARADEAIAEARALVADAPGDARAVVEGRAAAVAAAHPDRSPARRDEAETLLANSAARAETSVDVRLSRRFARALVGAPVAASPPPFEIVTRGGALPGAGLPADADLAFDAVERSVVVEGRAPLDLRKKPVMARLLEVVLAEPHASFDKARLYREVWHAEFRDVSQGAAVYKAVDRLARLLSDDPRRFLRWNETGALVLVAKRPALLRPSSA